MQPPTRILPDLQASLLCEDVRQDTSGSFILIGVIGFIRVPQVPITAWKLCLYNRWTAGIGTFTQAVRLVGPDGATPIRQSTCRFGLQDATHHAINVTVFTQIEFTTAGVYYVEVLVDDVMKLRFPVPVIVVTPPNQQQQQPQPPPEPK
ncbi:MAG TPA: hypothetical protein PLW35_11975 [Verrucomicrobiota bacterium]|nr:hypothetical protein [Verrucomicrobiota bacterium]